MPPRFAYWTILIDNKPTAFRAREREELLPTVTQLKRTNPNVELKWFAQGRLWDSQEAQRESWQKPPAARERRDRDWRPGGDHKDPRAKFDKEAQRRKRREMRAERDKLGPPRSDRSWSDKPPDVPRNDRPWQTKPTGPRAQRKPWQHQPVAQKPWNKPRPPSQRFGGAGSDRTWQTKPAGPPADRKPWQNKPAGPPADRKPWQNKQAGPPADRKPWQNKPAGPPADRKPWQNKPAGPRGERK